MPSKIELLLIISKRIDKIDALLNGEPEDLALIRNAARREMEQAWQEIDALIDSERTD